MQNKILFFMQFFKVYNQSLLNSKFNISYQCIACQLLHLNLCINSSLEINVDTWLWYNHGVKKPFKYKNFFRELINIELVLFSKIYS